MPGPPRWTVQSQGISIGTAAKQSRCSTQALAKVFDGLL